MRKRERGQKTEIEGERRRDCVEEKESEREESNIDIKLERKKE